MANVKMTGLPINPSIELFVHHWTHGHNYEDSTVLVDPNYKIVAFFDRKTENIDVIMTDIPFKGEGWIIANGEGKQIKTSQIKYEPLYVAMELEKYREEINTYRKQKDKPALDKLFEKVRQIVGERNKGYFKTLPL